MIRVKMAMRVCESFILEIVISVRGRKGAKVLVYLRLRVDKRGLKNSPGWRETVRRQWIV